MKVNIILVDECGDEVIADCIEERAVEALGNHLNDFVDMRVEEIERMYPEARWVYREDVKSLGEKRAEQWQTIYEENLQWAEENPDEIDGMDPFDWAIEATNDYFDYGAGADW